MREKYVTYTTRSLGRVALAIGLAIPLNFATARPDNAPIPIGVPVEDHAAVPDAGSVNKAGTANKAGTGKLRGLGIDQADALRGPTGISGTARVLDGDTIEIDGTRIRLEGIDAPERAQTCTSKTGTAWRCGWVAQRALEKLVAKKTVHCESRGRGSYGRMLGVCTVDGHEINALMIERGLAWAFIKYSDRYSAIEALARNDKHGIWQGAAMPAWEYRSNRWAYVEGSSPDGCAIKGNISRRGNIYHMPWGRWYGRVKIEQRKGERWFCSEVEAVKAGWRAVAMR